MAQWFRRRSEPDEELAELTVAAELGDDVAMGNVAVRLQVKGDRDGALHWWGRAWAAGNVVATLNLGMLHAVAGDANRAQVIWEKTAALGDPDAMLGLVKQALERGDAAGVESWVTGTRWNTGRRSWVSGAGTRRPMRCELGLRGPSGWSEVQSAASGLGHPLDRTVQWTLSSPSQALSHTVVTGGCTWPLSVPVGRCAPRGWPVGKRRPPAPPLS
ncbi:hypothetical protein ACFQ77_25915 [Streptomyces virginiae]|uniref:hypothetical protein n=1 Tax=Streptomyces virginiae TaxID=1961 RepID=UPI0036A5BB6E